MAVINGSYGLMTMHYLDHIYRFILQWIMMNKEISTHCII